MILKTSTALLVALSLSFTLAKAQDKKMVQDVEHAKAEFIKADAAMKSLFDNSSHDLDNWLLVHLLLKQSFLDTHFQSA